MPSNTEPNRRLIGWFIGTTIFTFTVLMHVTFPNLGGAGLRLPFNAAVWMGFGVMMALAMWPAARGTIRYSRFHIGLGFLLLALWLPFLWSWNEASLIALPRMLTVTAGAILLLGIAQLQLTKRDWWWIGFAMSLGVLTETVYSYAQYYLFSPNNWVGYDTSLNRPTGIFQQPNVLSSFLVTGLPISSWLIVESWKKWQKSIALLLPLATPTLIIIISSRTGWLAAMLVIPLCLNYLFSRKKSYFLSWLTALTIGTLIGLAVTYQTDTPARSSENITSYGPRLPLYQHNIRMIIEKPLFGWGYGRYHHDFIYSFSDWRSEHNTNKTAILVGRNFAHPHNELMLWWIEGGILPSASILAFSILLLYTTLSCLKNKERLILIALLIPLSVHSMTELPFYQSLPSWLFFVLILGLLEKSCFWTKNTKHRQKSLIRLGCWLVPPALIFFMATHLHTLWLIQDYIKSKGEHITNLTSIKNPFGSPRTIEYMIMDYQLRAARGMKNTEIAEKYLDWAEEYEKIAPSADLYANMLNASEIANSAQKESIIRKANHLFPGQISATTISPVHN